MIKYFLILLFFVANSSYSQVEKQLSRLKVTSCIKSKIYFQKENKDSISEKSIMFFNKKGTITKSLTEEIKKVKFNGRDSSLISSVITNYNKNGDILNRMTDNRQFLHYFTRDTVFTTSFSHTYKYNFFNRVKKEVFGNNASINSNKSIIYKYSFLGKLKKEIRCDINNDIFLVVFFYYKKGDLSKTESYNKRNKSRFTSVGKEGNTIVFLGDTLKKEFVTFYSYDKENRLVSKIKSNEINKEKRIELFVYDNNSEIHFSTFDSSFEKIENELIRFHEDGKIRSKITKNDSVYYYYNADGLLEREDHFDSNIESLLPEYSYSYEYSCSD